MLSHLLKKKKKEKKKERGIPTLYVTRSFGYNNFLRQKHCTFANETQKKNKNERHRDCCHIDIAKKFLQDFAFWWRELASSPI